MRIPKESKRRKKKKKKGPIQSFKSNMTYSNFFPGKPTREIFIPLIDHNSRNKSV